MTELLTVVGIIAALCAIAIPSIFAIRSALRFAQANNYAKSIFLAAQQNLTELRSDGGLDPVRGAGGAYAIPDSVEGFPDEFRSEYVYTFTGEEAFDYVLPATSVDGTIRSGQIVIEYNPVTGNVYSVFYYDGTDLNLVSEYQGGADRTGELPRDKASRRDLMVGYYDGSGLNSSQIELEQTQATVKFMNGEEGIVQVLIPMPESYFGDFDSFASALNVSLTIVGEQSMADAAAQPPEEGAEAVTPPVPLTMQIKASGNAAGCELDVDGRTVIIEYPIDSLANRRSFANYASGTQASGTNAQSLTTVTDEDMFIYGVLPGENITITATVGFEGSGTEMVRVSPGILSGVNPMFEYLQPSGNSDRYVLAVSNGRNLQNLNAIAPSIAQRIESVIFTSDIYWNDTVNYYNKAYAGGSTYHNTTVVGSQSVYDEAPARALPYFVPIHNADLFGTAQFIFPKSGDGISGVISNLINSAFGAYFNLNGNVPTLTDEIDVQFNVVTDAAGNKTYHAESVQHATIEGNGHRVFHINVDSTLYAIPNASNADKTLRGRFYATGANQVVDYNFTGLFGYINTPINNLHVVNPIVKGADLVTVQKLTPIYGDDRYFNIFTGKWEYIPEGYSYEEQINNPATGALIGASGYNTLITNCSTYIDKDARGYRGLRTGPFAYSASGTQNWYGVSGTGAVGGLVGYAKSHRTTTGIPDGDLSVLAFSRCFAAVNVSGTMREYSYTGKDYGYSNGVGGLIGNSQMTNFFECYASGNVLAEKCHAMQTSLADPDWHSGTFGESRLSLLYSGRKSWGAGGFVGSSHGTRYSSCFATGNVSASGTGSTQYGYNATAKGSGGFSGIMVLDGDHTYGNAGSSTFIAQTTIFTDCYAVGEAKLNSKADENFSGANGRTLFQNGIRIFSLNNVFNSSSTDSTTYIIGDYYRLYAPHVAMQHSAPDYKDIYVFRNSYYLTNYHIENDNPQANSNGCADPEPYDTFTNLPGYHTADSSWVTNQISQIKAIELTVPILGWQTGTYGSRYFTSDSNMETTYKNLFAQAYSTDSWNAANYSTTHGYDLNGVYPFSKIKGMDYYGDWPSKPSDVGMAYFESYVDDENFYYHFDKESTATLKTDDKVIVDKDGYAILSASRTSMTVSIGGNAAVTMAAPTQTFSTSSKEYHIFRLTDSQITEAAKCLEQSGEFYVTVTVKQDGKSYTMYFNPNVAKSQINPVEGNQNALKPDAAPTTMYVRSARQFKGIAALNNFWGEKYTYIQQLNIDAATYLWVDNMESADDYIKISSIGSSKKPFNASYTALCIDETTMEETQFRLSGFKPVEAGLFGFIGETGMISDLIVECGDDITAGSDQLEDVGILAGVSYGTIDNVDLFMAGNVTLTAKNCAGLLAAHSTGAIVDCDVTVEDQKTVTITAPNAGGLIGTAQGTADAKAVLTDCNITMSGAFIVNDSTNAGGIVGLATHLNALRMNAVLASMTVTLDTDTGCAGALAGYAQDSAFTGVISETVNGVKVNPVEITVSGTIAADNACAAGAIGGAENTTVTGVDVITNGISGNIAAGFLGSGVNTDVSNSIVTVNGNLSGTSGAAGAAGTIGSQSVFDHVAVTLNGVTVSSDDGSAAGYALEIMGEAFVNYCSVTLGAYDITTSADGTISGRTVSTSSAISSSAMNAAGFACVIDGTIGDASVTGPGVIQGSNASGFAVSVNGSVARGHVSPALTADANGYLYNSNANLTVSGSTAAAGFALNVAEKATIDNSYTLCSVASEATVDVEIEQDTSVPDETSVPEEASEPTEAQYVQICAAYGFAGTNAGTVNRCMANVDLTGGFSFVGTNSGLVTTSYGWYNNRSANEVVTRIQDSCNSSYFADMNSENIEVYDADGKYIATTLGNLNNMALQGFMTSYKSYPFNAKIKPENYPYPMLRDHYGNWYTPPQYAYGVAYYEFYDNDTKVAHLWDLSDTEITVEDAPLPDFIHGDGLDSEAGIISSGYAVFCKEGSGMLSELYGSEIPGLDYSTGKATYKFYAFAGSDTAPVSVPATAFSSQTAAVDTRFADAVVTSGVFGTYQIRTAYHLSNVRQLPGASFQQTHDITADGFNAIENFTGSYNGGGHGITVAAGSTWMTAVNGTVNNLTIDVTDTFTAPVFGAVSTAAGTADETVYALNGVAVNAGKNVNTVPAALLAASVAGESAVNDCSVTAHSVSTVAENFGGLVTTNAGTLNGCTVMIDTLTANGSGIVGGMTAANSGTISGSTEVSADITYTGGSGAVIGGLTGTNAGNITGAAVSGSVKRGDTADGVYTIGGAVGSMTAGTVQQTNSAVTVDKQWAKADESDPTFGSSGIINNGPVGMFVGYAGDAALENCSSTAANDTFQYLGHASIGSTDFNATLWKSGVLNTTGIQAYGPASENGYTAFSPDGVVLEAATNAPYVNIHIKDCFFNLGEAKYQQVYGMDTYYYSADSAEQSMYTITRSPVSAAATLNSNVEFKWDSYSNEPTATNYYYLHEGTYSRVYAKRVTVESSSIFERDKYYIYLVDESGNVLEYKERAYVRPSIFQGYYAAYFDVLYTLAAPTGLPGMYLAVNDAENALDSNWAVYSLPTEGNTFEQRDELYGCVWTVSGSKITNMKTGTEKEITAAITYDSTLHMVYSDGTVFFRLYPLDSRIADYTLVTFAYQNNENYQRQFVSSVAVTEN